MARQTLGLPDASPRLEPPATDLVAQRGPRVYLLNVNGPLLKKQREFLYALFNGKEFPLSVEQHDLVGGLVCLTDDIADQAHDRWSIDSLLACDDAGKGDQGG